MICIILKCVSCDFLRKQILFQINCIIDSIWVAYNRLKKESVTLFFLLGQTAPKTLYTNTERLWNLIMCRIIFMSGSI